MVPEDMKHIMVKDLIDANGGWRFELLIPWLPCYVGLVTRHGRRIGFGYGVYEFHSILERLFG
jgi:hypothetical protein